jgi:ATP-dependent RNA helicase DDX10/DBP4
MFAPITTLCLSLSIYLSRAGRTARYNTSGESLLLLLPSEEKGMMKILAAHKIPIERIEVSFFYSFLILCVKNIFNKNK